MGPFVVQRMIGVQLLLINSIYRKQCVVTMCSMSRIIPKSEGEEPNIEIRKNKKSSLSFEYKVKWFGLPAIEDEHRTVFRISKFVIIGPLVDSSPPVNRTFRLMVMECAKGLISPASVTSLRFRLQFRVELQFDSSMLASSCLHKRLTAHSTAHRKLCMPCCASGSKCRWKVRLISSRWLKFIAGSTLPNLRGKGASTPRVPPPPPPLLSSRTRVHSREPFLSSCAASGTHVCLEHKLWFLLRFVPCETRESLLCPIYLAQ